MFARGAFLPCREWIVQIYGVNVAAYFSLPFRETPSARAACLWIASSGTSGKGAASMRSKANLPHVLAVKDLELRAIKLKVNVRE